MERHVGVIQLELSDEQLDHLGAHPGLGFEANGTTEATTAEFHLDGREQIVGLFFFEREVGVAGDTEREALLDHHARVEQVHVGRDHLFDRHEAPAVGQAEEAGEHGGHLHPREATLTGVGVRHHRRQAEGEVRDVRERVRRIDGERREYGKDPSFELFGQRLAIGHLQFDPVEDLDAASLQFRQKPTEQHALLA